MKTIQIEIPAYLKRLLSSPKGYIQSVEVLNEVFSAYFEEQVEKAIKGISGNIYEATTLKRQLLQIVSDTFEGLGEDSTMQTLTIQDYYLDFYQCTPDSPKEIMRTLISAFDAYGRSDYGRDVCGEFFDMLCQIRAAFVEILLGVALAISYMEPEKAAA